MTPKKVKQLIKLLHEFSTSTEKDGTTLNSRERSVIAMVAQWVIWYGRDELGMDL